jgi:gamma-glutamyltranspeptidase/glutathione hydrolase
MVRMGLIMQQATPQLSRRGFLRTASAALLAAHTPRVSALALEPGPASNGFVLGQAEGAAAGMRVLADGGNAVDAAVTAALVAGVVALPMCGIGGYGGHAVIGQPDGRVAAIDFNSAAPAATRDDMFPLDARGEVAGAINTYGWLAAGVPGTLAGLQLAQKRFGTRPLSSVLEPAIRYARDGFAVDKRLAQSIAAARAHFERDAGSAKLFLPGGSAPAEGDTFRNPDLAALLERLARDNSVDDFYLGHTAGHIAREFAKHGGLVTESDLASYQARQVEPYALDWRGATIHTAPLTAGGLSVLQTLATLRQLAWENSDPDDPRAIHARIEAVRLAWNDRLALLGDPVASDVPVARLLSREYADASARTAWHAVEERSIVPGTTERGAAGGTIHLTAADKSGMMVALTLTHGGGFGARVTVDGLGLLLGHGMSRFEPKPGHANAPRGGCRPLNNMCPTIVTRGGRPVAALGATGGRRIPNTLVDVLSHYVGRGMSLADAAAVPRLHTEGDATLALAKGWSDADRRYLAGVGYTLKDGAGANLNAITRDPASGAIEHVP